MFKIEKRFIGKFIGNLQKDTLPFKYRNMFKLNKFLLKVRKDNSFDIFYTGMTINSRPKVIIHCEMEKVDGDLIISPKLCLWWTHFWGKLMAGTMAMCYAGYISGAAVKLFVIYTPLMLICHIVCETIYYRKGELQIYPAVCAFIKKEIKKSSKEQN
ncbi:hypothetical protein SAMN06296386_10367 [Lachnospiraceae bacterium]|nr:hypothetical protein SAMN06296386_10367 [Lachnospiraceae bacterium]